MIAAMCTVASPRWARVRQRMATPLGTDGGQRPGH